MDWESALTVFVFKVTCDLFGVLTKGNQIREEMLHIIQGRFGNKPKPFSFFSFFLHPKP